MKFKGGEVAIISISRKQKMNTPNSTEAELVGVDDMVTLLLWWKLFMEAQGCKIEENMLYQDDKSAILLENNRKISSGKRTRSSKIRYFYITDQVAKENVSICTGEDWGGVLHGPARLQKHP